MLARIKGFLLRIAAWFSCSKNDDSDQIDRAW